MTSVRFGRTVSIDYQSQRTEVEFDVLPGWTITDTYNAAKAFVTAKLGSKLNQEQIELVQAYMDAAQTKPTWKALEEGSDGS